MAASRFGTSLAPPPLTGSTAALPATSSTIHFPSSSWRLFVQFNCANSSPRAHSPTLEALISSSSVRPQITGRSRAILNEESVVTEEISGGFSGSRLKKEIRPCELYVCNLPRSCDIPQLVEIFKSYGTVVSVEVSKNPETGVSRGCGYVTMGSQSCARKAMCSLDGSLRKKFSEFGNVVSARVLYDRKGGKNRAYGFISFSTSAEREASLCLDGTVKSDI
ncbi:unnamed protein product [Linum tenue]|uniref:RRM domain-containing protein n=1 Tax=Linum tenue TaxID=586396 RepID=A0AAV0KTD1_9ROSI|nr:unnamed protein product [Linum tenue]